MTDILTRWILIIRLRLLDAVGSQTNDGMLVWAALIGLVGGISSAAFREANIGLKWMLTGQSGDIVAIAQALSPTMRLLIPTLGGLCAGFTLLAGTRLFNGMRSQDYLEVIRLGNGVISFRPTIARLISSLFSISSGASIGREAGMVQLSALCASGIGRLCNFSSPKLRLLVACGGAAGLASAYNTPLAGALFIAEVVLQSLAIEALGPLVVASVVATLTIRHWIGVRPIFVSPHLHSPLDVHFFSVLGLGILAGLLSPLFLMILDQARQFYKRLHLPVPVNLALGGFLVGVISLDEPGVWGNGHAVVEALLNNHAEQHWVYTLLLLKILATAAAVGSGAVGGVFTPTLFIGAGVGWLYCHELLAIFPGLNIDTVTYAALGMGAFLAGTTHAPVMAILMIFEMTLDGNILFSLIVVAITARYLSVTIHPNSAYAQALGNVSTRLPYLMHVADIQTPPSLVVDQHVASTTVSEMFCRSSAQQIWMVDEQGYYQGAISLQAMKLFLGDPDLTKLRAAYVFMEDDSPVVTPQAALSEALSAFAHTHADRLPVVSNDRKLLGEITKTDVLLMLS